MPSTSPPSALIGLAELPGVLRHVGHLGDRQALAARRLLLPRRLALPVVEAEAGFFAGMRRHSMGRCRWPPGAGRATPSRRRVPHDGGRVLEALQRLQEGDAVRRRLLGLQRVHLQPPAHRPRLLLGAVLRRPPADVAPPRRMGRGAALAAAGGMERQQREAAASPNPASRPPRRRRRARRAARSPSSPRGSRTTCGTSRA